MGEITAAIDGKGANKLLDTVIGPYPAPIRERFGQSGAIRRKLFRGCRTDQRRCRSYPVRYRSHCRPSDRLEYESELRDRLEHDPPRLLPAAGVR